MVVRLNISKSRLQKDIKSVKESLPEEREVAKALRRGVEKTAKEFADAVNKRAPSSDGDEYDASYSDEKPPIELSDSFYYRHSGRSPFSFEVVSSQDDRAFLLEVGDPNNRRIEADDGVLAIHAPGHPDANEDGRIFREFVTRGPIEGRKYIEETYNQFRAEYRLTQNIDEELDKVLD